MLDSGRTSEPPSEGGANAERDLPGRSLEPLTRLQRSALRLAFSFYGRYPELDRHLAALHGRLRAQRGATDLVAAIESLFATIIRLQSLDSARGDEAAYAALAQLAASIPWPSAHAAEVWRLRHRLEGRGRRGELLSLVEELASLLARCLHEDDAPPAAPASGGLVATVHTVERMLDRIQPPPDLAATLARARAQLRDIAGHAELLAVLDEVASLLSRSLRAPGTQDEAWTEPLVQLLERVSFPPELAPELGALKAALAGAPERTERGWLITRAANLITAAQHRLQCELEQIAGFLRQTTLRLQDLHARLLQSQRVRQEAFKEGQRIGTVVQEHVEGIRASIDSAIDLASLRRSIDQRLNSIDADMRAFIAAESRRNDAAERMVSALSTQLQDLESETLQLRQSLEEERAKAVRDGLTGIANRLGYEERLAQELARFRRHGRPLSLAIFDIDCFKTINDEYGHHAGDKVLITVAEQMRRQIRESDFFARYGGEEFVLLLPETRLAEALQLADKLRLNVERCRFRYGDAPVPVTVSCGVTEFLADDDAETVFQRADLALYAAKRAGRNRCCTEPALHAA